MKQSLEMIREMVALQRALDNLVDNKFDYDENEIAFVNHLCELGKSKTMENLMDCWIDMLRFQVDYVNRGYEFLYTDDEKDFISGQSLFENLFDLLRYRYPSCESLVALGERNGFSLTDVYDEYKTLVYFILDKNNVPRKEQIKRVSSEIALGKLGIKRIDRWAFPL